MEKLESEKPKTRFSTKVYFWFFIVFAVLALFMLYLERGEEGEEIVGGVSNIAVAIGAICLSIFFATIVFIRFVRSRSITGGLFLTTCISSGVFLGTAQLIPLIVPPTAAAFGGGVGIEDNSFQLLLILAQIGLFSLWFGFLLFNIFLYVRPIKKVDKYISKIIEGEEFQKVKIGHARQYKVLEEKIKFLSKNRDSRGQEDFAKEVLET